MKANELFEARLKRGAEYTQKTKKNRETGEVAIERIIAELSSGKRQDEFRDAARMYERLNAMSKRLTEKKNNLNTELTEATEKLFDAADEVSTRVVKAAEMELTLAKVIEKPAADIEMVDYQGILAELFETRTDLVEILTELKNKYTKIEKVEASKSKPALRVKNTSESVVVEGITKDFFNKVFQFTKSVYNKTMAKLKDVDAKLESIQSKTSSLGKSDFY